MSDEDVALRGRDASERLDNARRDDDGIPGIEPVMRVGHTVRMAPFVDHTLTADLEARNAHPCVDVTFAAAHQPLVAHTSAQRLEPEIVAAPDAHQQPRTAH